MKNFRKGLGLAVVIILGFVPFALSAAAGFVALVLKFGWVFGHDEVYTWLKKVRFE